MNPRREAIDRLGDRYDARVLEPSPPAVTEEPFADDPVAPGDTAPCKQLVSPVTNADLTWDELARDDPALADWCATRWLGAWRPLPPLTDSDRLTDTRRAWHAVAEHVVAPARHAVTGKIGLRFSRHGFGTPFFSPSGGREPGDDRQVRVEGVNLVTDANKTRWAILANLGAAANLVRIEPGAPTDVYTPTTPCDPDEPLRLDARSTELLAAWFGFGASVLEQLRAESGPDVDPSRVQLWPEHFDLAVDVGDEARGRRGTFGASPGDDAHPAPYLYVTQWTPDGDVAADPFWNDRSFAGASLGYEELLPADDQREAALTFLRRGRDLLRG